MKRFRGMNAILRDATNYNPTSPSPYNPPAKRVCASKANTNIQNSLKVLSPRGIHAVTAEPLSAMSTSSLQEASTEPSEPTSIQEDTDAESSESQNVSFRYVMSHTPHVIEEGLACIKGYVERNTPFALQKAFALQLFATLVLDGMEVLSACDLVAKCTASSSRTVRRWASDVFGGFFFSLSTIDNVTDEVLELELSSGMGRHPKWVSLISDENFKKDARRFIVDNGYVKGKPNLTLSDFTKWVVKEKGVSISISTASVWLHQMGFTHKQFSKGVYFDGHERDDVVADRKSYMNMIESYKPRMWVSHSPAPSPSYHPVVRVYHDESTFYANADQSFYWSDGSTQVLKQKSLGQAIMVSDFLEEVNGFLDFDGERARLMLETQTEGYFTNEMLITRVRKAVTLFEKKYPAAQGLFFFDHAPSHMKKPENALNADRMNVKDGGKQPYMKDTVWNGSVQRMVTESGLQKGLKTVLEERGVSTRGLNAEKLRDLLQQYEVCL